MNNDSLAPIISIIPLSERKVFTHEEALDVVPLLQRITAKTKKDLGVLNSRLSNCRSNDSKAQNIQEEINSTLQSWSDKVRRIGGIPVSLAKVRFAAEDGAYLWDFSEGPRLFLY